MGFEDGRFVSAECKELKAIQDGKTWKVRSFGYGSPGGADVLPEVRPDCDSAEYNANLFAAAPEYQRAWNMVPPEMRKTILAALPRRARALISAVEELAGDRHQPGSGRRHDLLLHVQGPALMVARSAVGLFRETIRSDGPRILVEINPLRLRTEPGEEFYLVVSSEDVDAFRALITERMLYAVNDWVETGTTAAEVEAIRAAAIQLAETLRRR